MKPLSILLLTLLALPMTGVFAEAGEASSPWLVEARAGAAVPTFDITDLAETGFVYGFTIGYRPMEKWVIFGAVDLGKHNLKGLDADINVQHYMAKAGYELYRSEDERLQILANLGAGALTFDPDVSGATSNTYFAINAGAKVYYKVNDVVGIVLSPQGDIAFTNKDDGFTGSTAWVWPFTAGVALNF